ncbi:MAG: preprotein translocase subunit SecG [Chitinophagaceae bacterium]
MIFFLILIVIAAVAMALFILIQNPKGGGLAGNIAGFNSQFMGVKQTTDVLEKGTWVLAVVIALLCLCSAFFIPKGATGSKVKETNAKPAATAPALPAAPAQTAPATPAPAQSNP